MKGNTSILKYFLQFACTNLDGSQKEGSTQKGEGFLQKRGATNPAENCHCIINKEKTTKNE